MGEKGDGKTNYDIGKYLLKFENLKSGISSQSLILSYFEQTSRLRDTNEANDGNATLRLAILKISMQALPRM